MSNRLTLPLDVVKPEALQKWIHFAHPVPPTIHDWGKNGGRITGGDGKKRPAFGWPLFHFFSGRAAFSRVLCKNHLIWTWQNFSGTKPVLGSPQPVLFSFCQGCKGWVPMFRGLWSPFIFVVKKEFSRKFFGDFVPRREFRACGKSLDNPIGMPRSFSQILAQRSPRKGFF